MAIPIPQTPMLYLDAPGVGTGIAWFRMYNPFGPSDQYDPSTYLYPAAAWKDKAAAAFSAIEISDYTPIGAAPVGGFFRNIAQASGVDTNALGWSATSPDDIRKILDWFTLRPKDQVDMDTLKWWRDVLPPKWEQFLTRVFKPYVGTVTTPVETYANAEGYLLAGGQRLVGRFEAGAVKISIKG